MCSAIDVAPMHSFPSRHRGAGALWRLFAAASGTRRGSEHRAAVRSGGGMQGPPDMRILSELDYVGTNLPAICGTSRQSEL